MKATKIFSWITRSVAAVILLQTLFFKFTAAPESVALFTQLGVEPWGRIGLGVAELIVAILLLIPRTAWLGAIGGIGLMIGAIGAHLTTLGIVFNDDGGALFTLAVVTLVSSVIALFLHKNDIPFLNLGKNPITSIS